MTRTIRNPILPGFNPDPSIVRVGDDFYIATSTFEWYPGVQIHHSRDLKHWRLAHRPLNRKTLLDMRGNPDSCGVWAPCLSWHDGVFHLIYSDVKRFDGDYKDAHNYLTTCETIDGEWSDPVYLNSSGFDPSLFHDDDGKKYLLNMVWDHRHGRNRFGGIYLQAFSTAERKLVGPVTNIFKGTALGLTEAPHLFKRGDYYYLLTAEGGTAYTHAMTLARSKNITGPYECDPQGYLLTTKDNQDLPIQRTGHGDLFDTPSGETYLVHLCGRPLDGTRRCPLGRETGLQKTRWSDDGWLRIEGATGDGLPALDVVAPDLAPHPWPVPPTRRLFDDANLAPEFQWLRSPEPEKFMSLKARPGFLRLAGKESIGSWFEQALIARRQEHLSFVAQTQLDVSPTSFQHMAGLTCYYNTHKFHYCYISVDEQGRRFVDIMSCLGDISGSLFFPLREGATDPDFFDPRFMLPNGPISLRCEVDLHRLVFSWSADEKIWHKLPVHLDHTIVSDEAGKGEGASFTGAFVGMACQDVSGADSSADFAYFEYLPK